MDGDGVLAMVEEFSRRLERDAADAADLAAAASAASAARAKKREARRVERGGDALPERVQHHA